MRSGPRTLAPSHLPGPCFHARLRVHESRGYSAGIFGNQNSTDHTAGLSLLAELHIHRMQIKVLQKALSAHLPLQPSHLSGNPPLPLSSPGGTRVFPALQAHLTLLLHLSGTARL